MYCPLCVDKGYMFDCKRGECAWWDSALEQCCIKTMSVAPVIANSVPKATEYVGIDRADIQMRARSVN